MKITFCDLCSCPIHGVKFTLMIVTEEDMKNFAPYPQTMSQSKSTSRKEICEVCKCILDKLFTNRKKGLADLVKTLEDTFKLTAKKPRKKRKPRK